MIADFRDLILGRRKDNPWIEWSLKVQQVCDAIALYRRGKNNRLNFAKRVETLVRYHDLNLSRGIRCLTGDERNSMSRFIGILFSIGLALVATSSLEAADPSVPRLRRVLYNFDGDSCLSTKAGGQGPVDLTADDVKRLIGEVAYDGSQVDSILVCINPRRCIIPLGWDPCAGLFHRLRNGKNGPLQSSSGSKISKPSLMPELTPIPSCWKRRNAEGKEALLTFRMNDDHGNDFLRTQFRADHPEFQLGSGALNFDSYCRSRLHVSVNRRGLQSLRRRWNRTRFQSLSDVLQVGGDRRTNR